MVKKSISLSIIFLFFSASAVFAHQPIIVSSEPDIKVLNPEISKAYYGELVGEPVRYIINSDKPFNLYVGVLVPDISGVKKDVSAAVIKDGQMDVPFAVLEGVNFDWKPFYEEFGGDDYFQGPEFKKQVESGSYEIRVWSSNNFGKYVLAIGETESFSLRETINTLATLPKLKTDFFGKPAWTAYFNSIGLYVVLPAIVLFALIAVILIYAFKKSKKFTKIKMVD